MTTQRKAPKIRKPRKNSTPEWGEPTQLKSLLRLNLDWLRSCAIEIVSAVVLAVLLVFSGWFVFDAWRWDREMTARLDAQIDAGKWSLKTLEDAIDAGSMPIFIDAGAVEWTTAYRADFYYPNPQRVAVYGAEPVQYFSLYTDGGLLFVDGGPLGCRQ